ncbi:hypothetical protein [Clostridium sp. JS66]|uniref:hypothetical protein n=1 Tax=Clostridium sp. JS66 TaxID=3064705 RepID=UPI00298E89EA|nr:hypothetical protein [Clostridium sp. JS66]WPC39661.1 hypothetical protein Q6H37_17270 [Clostridium sp. JS66]
MLNSKKFKRLMNVLVIIFTVLAIFCLIKDYKNYTQLFLGLSLLVNIFELIVFVIVKKQED